MPYLALELKCSLTGVTDLQPNDPENFHWHLKLKCTNCGEAPSHWQYVVANESLEVPGSRGEANLVEKCKLCGRVNTLNIIEDSFKSYSAENNEKWQPIVTFDCRGIEPYDFDPRNDWIAKGSESNTSFNDIDLTEKTWADYDEQASEAVEVNDVVVQFSHVKAPKK